MSLLGKAYRRLQTFNKVARFTGSNATPEEQNIWSVCSDLSAEISKLPNDSQKAARQEILQYLIEQKDWPMSVADYADNTKPDNKLYVVCEGLLDRLHKVPLHTEGLTKQIRTLQKEEIREDFSSYNFLTDRVDDMREAADSVLKAPEFGNKSSASPS